MKQVVFTNIFSLYISSENATFLTTGSSMMVYSSGAYKWRTLDFQSFGNVLFVVKFSPFLVAFRKGTAFEGFSCTFKKSDIFLRYYIFQWYICFYLESNMDYMEYVWSDYQFLQQFIGSLTEGCLARKVCLSFSRHILAGYRSRLRQNAMSIYSSKMWTEIVVVPANRSTCQCGV